MTTTPDSKPGREKNAYRASLNLPKTAFPMKANLVQNEPASIERWNRSGLYRRTRDARAGAPTFVFHDGPPYANGSIHLGHLMNKCLKDFVVRSQTMLGKDVPYVPGWDCHGLPIEHKVLTELKEAGKLDKLASLDESQRRLAIRRECKKYAEKFHKLHTKQMTRLLTLADYDDPYLTMHPGYEGAVLEVLADLVEQGVVFRALKPVHWSVEHETALADAELEYHDRRDISVYVDFEAGDAGAVYDAFGLSEDDRPDHAPSFMIWTTTPWTLPANLAIAVNERFRYALVKIDGAVTVLAEDLVEQVAKLADAEEVQTLATTTGDRLLGLGYRHPFVPIAQSQTCFKVYAAEYVTLDDGTGLVHTAPGHGTEDYQTGLREGLPVYCPVLGDGSYDPSVPTWLVGKNIWEANALIVERLRESGHLFHDHTFTHSYPHDWRSKTPVIFRCTEQWFVGVDRPTARDGRSLRRLALDTTASDVGFVPAWGKNRMRGMLESRPDWCISRQRAWGLPIPAFYSQDADGNTVTLLTAASVRAVALYVRENGSDAWFTDAPEQLLSRYDPASDPDAPFDTLPGALTKSADILDVWFESGSSWNAVMRQRFGDDAVPVELYLEGSDQHRGWFQLSLLPALGSTGRPPFKAVLTHGFINDREGKKLSKSRKDAADYEVDNLLEQYGADVMRWWVASLAYENDVKADLELFALSGESYRKIRNTLRFMLSNLSDAPLSDNDRAFDPASLAAIQPSSIDAYVLHQCNTLRERVLQAYTTYAFKDAHQLLYNFANDALSATYLSAVKDRLYCDAPGAPRRRQTQTTLAALTDALCKLIAPIMPHTADEAYRTLRGVDTSDTHTTVHLETFPEPFPVAAHGSWERFMRLRDDALRALETAKESRGIENPLDAGVTLPNNDGALDPFDPVDLADLLGVSRVALDPGATGPTVQDLREEPRCERSWKRDGTVRQRSDGGMLSDRDASALGLD